MIWIWRPFACSPCQVQTKAPQTLINIGMNFGVRVAFDYGNCTGPDCKFDWEPLGLEMEQGTTLSLSLDILYMYEKTTNCMEITHVSWPSGEYMNIGPSDG